VSLAGDGVVHASQDKVHLDMQFGRWRADCSLIGRYRSPGL
jgi:hypothetical protein